MTTGREERTKLIIGCIAVVIVSVVLAGWRFGRS